MQEHPNATRIRALFAAFKDGDAQAILGLIPEDAVWHFPGRRGKLAGSHRGREAIFKFLMDVSALTDGTFNLELADVIDGWLERVDRLLKRPLQTPSPADPKASRT